MPQLFRHQQNCRSRFCGIDTQMFHCRVTTQTRASCSHSCTSLWYGSNVLSRKITITVMVPSLFAPGPIRSLERIGPGAKRLWTNWPCDNRLSPSIHDSRAELTYSILIQRRNSWEDIRVPIIWNRPTYSTTYQATKPNSSHYCLFWLGRSRT